MMIPESRNSSSVCPANTGEAQMMIPESRNSSSVYPANTGEAQMMIPESRKPNSSSPFIGWVNNPNPKHVSFPAHGSSVVTCLIFSRGRIISATDDHSIRVYSPATGKLVRSLEGHEGGVWALAARKDTLVSGSTDRTVRIWNLSTGKCTHVFGGHTSTVRCLSIVKPELVNVERDGVVTKEKWPKRPLIVTGSRDHSLRVWALPRPGDVESSYFGPDKTGVDLAVADVSEHRDYPSRTFN
jgi:F-box and WD-40 domain protein CDC4